jgi:hypothetical protein
MEDADFSDAFCRFIQNNIPSVEAAERLLEAYRPGGPLPAPLAEEQREHLDTLARAYRERPVTLVRIIYALRDSRIQSFAEAFRLRKR